MPTTDPDPTLLPRMYRTTAAVKDHGETYDTQTLALIRGAAMELEQATDRELMRRAKL